MQLDPVVKPTFAWMCANRHKGVVLQIAQTRNMDWMFLFVQLITVPTMPTFYAMCATKQPNTRKYGLDVLFVQKEAHICATKKTWVPKETFLCHVCK